MMGFCSGHVERLAFPEVLEGLYVSVIVYVLVFDGHGRGFQNLFSTKQLG